MLERFLILGTDGPTYYSDEEKRTFENYENILKCLDHDFVKTIDTIVDVSHNGRSSNNDYALFALAVAASFRGGKDDGYGSRVYAMQNLQKVARIGTHLFTFVDFLYNRRPFGRTIRKGISNWYENRSYSSLGLQLAKYQSRNGWSHADVIKLAHVKSVEGSVMQNALAWALGKEYNAEQLPKMIIALERMKRALTPKEVVSLIEEYDAPREIIPTQFLYHIDVWNALLPHMGAEAMVRNLGNMTNYGVLDIRDNVDFIINRMEDTEWLKSNRIHPMKILIAMYTYNQGHGTKGHNTWRVDRNISNALERGFYNSFSVVVPTGKRICYALDVSSSMSWGTIGNLSGFTPCSAEAAMTLVLQNTEKNYATVGFSHNIVDVNINPSTTIEHAVAKIRSLNYGATDASLPFIWAKNNRYDFDAFVMMTDAESWYGRIHPFFALNEYRNFVGHDVKLVTMAFVANDSTIGDKTDPNALDVVGFDSNVPSIINNFIS